MILFHSTTLKAAVAILENGFRPSTGNFLNTDDHSGVWAPDRAAEENEGAKGSTVLRMPWI